jgi:hypothetical protein
MCTVHSFPHNIDHCLTWARSEFEGLLDKGPREANVYLADPAKYIGELDGQEAAAAGRSPVYLFTAGPLLQAMCVSCMWSGTVR